MADETRRMTGTVLAVLGVGLVLIIGIYILSQMQQTFQVVSTAQIGNETGVVNATTNMTLSAAQVEGFTNPALLQAINLTGGTVALGNFSVTAAGLVIRAAGAGNFNYINITYTYTFDGNTSSSDAAGQNVTALSNGTPWLSILIVVAFAVIVISLLTRGFKTNEATSHQQLTY